MLVCLGKWWRLCFVTCEILQELKELWAKHSCTVNPKPHSRNSSSWNAITKVYNSELKYLALSPPISKVLNLIVFKRMKELDVILAGLMEEVALSIFLSLNIFILPFDVQQIRKNERNLGLKHFRPIKPLGCGDTGRFSLSWNLGEKNAT